MFFPSFPPPLSYNSMMTIVAMIEDLLFRTKVEAAASRLGVPVTLAPDGPAAVQALRQAAAPLLLFVDLNHAGLDPLDAIRTVRRASPSARIIGYYAHVREELRAQAAAAGCTEVLPRSAFVQRLPTLLA